MDQECEKCGRVYAVREGCDPTRFCDDCAHDIAEGSCMSKKITVNDILALGDIASVCIERDKLRFQLEWLWKNCRIVYYPKDEGYPIEHTLAAEKDMRSVIEMEMRK